MSADELLAQATCAVLVGDRIKGTAWLCSTAGHLITAGHVLGDRQPLETVQVKFLGDIPRDAKKIAWAYHEATGTDWAVLMLTAPPKGRQPLPMSFPKELDGSFILRGFGATLADLSTGRGHFIGSVEVQNSSEFRLFRLRSQELGEGGYSGGAVFSDQLGTVVAIQIESPKDAKLVGRDTILAMPLYRVPHIWEPQSGLQETSGELESTHAYRYHILVSYSRKEAIRTWVEDFFVPELRKWLDEELPDETPQIFWNHDDVRQPWTRPMMDIVRESRYMIAILTPSYFRSEHCLAELESFSVREELERAALLSALEWHGEFPKEIRQNRLNFREFAITTPGFKNSDLYIKFQERVKSLAADIGLLLRKVPPYQSTWPVVAPVEVRTRISAPPRIPKPQL